MKANMRGYVACMTAAADRDTAVVSLEELLPPVVAISHS